MDTKSFKQETNNLVNKFMKSKEVNFIIEQYYSGLKNKSDVKKYINVLTNKSKKQGLKNKYHFLKQNVKTHKKELSELKYSKKSQQAIIHVVKVLTILQDYLKLIKDNQKCTDDMRKFYFILIFLKDQIKSPKQDKIPKNLNDILRLISQYLKYHTASKKSNITKTTQKIRSLLEKHDTNNNLSGGAFVDILTNTVRNITTRNITYKAGGGVGMNKINKVELGSIFLEELEKNLDNSNLNSSNYQKLLGKLKDTHKKYGLFHENPNKKV